MTWIGAVPIEEVDYCSATFGKYVDILHMWR